MSLFLDDWQLVKLQFCNKILDYRIFSIMNYTRDYVFEPTEMTPWIFQRKHRIWRSLKALYIDTDLALMFIGPCIIAIVHEWKTNLMTLAILFHLLCAQHVSDINISIFRSLRLCWWITTSVVLFSVPCVLELLVRVVFGGVRFAGWSLQNEHYSNPATPNLQHTTNWEQDNQSGNSSTQSQAPDDGYINVRNMLST